MAINEVEAFMVINETEAFVPIYEMEDEGNLKYGEL